MTLEEAQAEFASIIQRISTDCIVDEILEIKRDLLSFLARLPNIKEFDLLAVAINEIHPKLSGMITAAIAADIKSRNAVLQGAFALLDEIAEEAEADASELRLEEPKFILQTLTKSVESLKVILSAARNGNYVDAATKAEVLVIVLEQARDKIKLS